jgi:hypothetical protein
MTYTHLNKARIQSLRFLLSCKSEGDKMPNTITDYTNDELLSAYDTYSTLMARGVRDEIYLTQVENELNRRGIEYKLDDIIMRLFKQVNEEENRA